MVGTCARVPPENKKIPTPKSTHTKSQQIIIYLIQKIILLIKEKSSKIIR